jgi:23S rRNA (cytosine1962-C5)-methyltransferase
MRWRAVRRMQRSMGLTTLSGLRLTLSNASALRILSPGGTLLTASCSFHVQLPQFLGMLIEAAADSGRRITLERVLGQGEDHPVVLTIPETGYLKGALLKAAGG